MIRTPRFTEADSQAAYDAWGFNCGPGALCAILNLTPTELRPLMGDFENKRYTNPTLMQEVLHRSGKKYRQTYRSDKPVQKLPPVEHGLIKIHWGGPWTKPGVPMQARYRQTHWIGVRSKSAEVFDVNAMASQGGGWLKVLVWETQLVPWLCGNGGVPKWDGTWWATNAIEVEA